MRTERCALTSTSMVDRMQDMVEAESDPMTVPMNETRKQMVGMPDQGARVEATGGES